MRVAYAVGYTHGTRHQHHQTIARSSVIAQALFSEDTVRRNPRSFWPVAVLFAMGGCMNPEVEAKQWDEIQGLNQTMTEMRKYVQDLETLVDSLRNVDMKQDRSEERRVG